jgi:hypothetical protein
MNFKSLSTIQTKYIKLKEIDQFDLEDIIKLRTSKSNNHLSIISSSIDDQRSYYESYRMKRSIGAEIYYKIIDKNKPQKMSGLVRLTEIDNTKKFSWESLIVADGAAPYTSLDAIITIYRVGFEELQREVCGPWTIPIKAKNVYNLHVKIGMAEELSQDQKFYHMIVKKQRFLDKFEFFRKLGFGLYKFHDT